MGHCSRYRPVTLILSRTESNQNSYEHSTLNLVLNAVLNEDPFMIHSFLFFQISIGTCDFVEHFFHHYLFIYYICMKKIQTEREKDQSRAVFWFILRLVIERGRLEPQT